MATRHLPPTATGTRHVAFLTLTAISFPLYGYPAPTGNSYRYPSRGFFNTYRHKLPALWLPGTYRQQLPVSFTAISFPLYGYPVRYQVPTAMGYRTPTSTANSYLPDRYRRLAFLALTDIFYFYFYFFLFFLLTDISFPGMCLLWRTGPPCCWPILELIGTLECRVRFLLKELEENKAIHQY